jgi:two-component system response regulator YesN
MQLCFASVDEEDRRIRLVRRLIEEQYSDTNLHVGNLAQQVGLSSRHLSRLFKKNIGIGFREYLRTVRMNKAEELLKTTCLSIKQVAAAVGYKYVSDFDQHFKMDYGLKPGEFRNRSELPNEYPPVLKDCC